MNNTQKNTYSTVPDIRPDRFLLLKRLSEACAVSGNEAEVRAIVLEQIKPLCSETWVDALGNVLAIKPGTRKNCLRVMVAAHMDEVGMMITKNEGDGIFRFETVGGLDIHTLPGKPVKIGKSHVNGVIGTKPIHLSNPTKSVEVEDLRIDVSPGNAAEVQVGDWATFHTTFERWGPSISGKALDDRIGVEILIDLLRNAPEHIDLLAAFTVQEEIGLRGAYVAAYTLNPDLAIVLDCTPARDLPSISELAGSEEIENYRYNTRVGYGPAIYCSDGDTISDPRLVRYFVQAAEAARIPYQIRQPGGGGTDAGAIHRQRKGIPSISISVPGRYAHSPVMVARISDWANTQALVTKALEELPADIFSSSR